MRAPAYSGEISVAGDAEIDVQPARWSELSELVRVEALAWPSGQAMRADAAKFACRIALGGVLVARRQERLIGFLSTFRPHWASPEALEQILSSCPAEILALPAVPRWNEMRRRYRLPASWHAATDEGHLWGGRLHRPAGEVVFGVGIATDPRERGRHVASALLAAALSQAARSGARYFLAYSRLPQYRHFPLLSIDDYLAMTAIRGGRAGPYDFGFRLHWSVGAQPARSWQGGARYVGIPTTMRDDVESRGCGVLVITPLGQAPRG